MVRHSVLKSLKALTILLGIFLIAPAAFAMDLNSAKAAGHVGEQANGYLGHPKGSAPSAAVSLKNDVNAKRKAKYNQLANKNGTKLSDVERIVGEKLIKRASSGQWVRLANGKWVKKP